MTTSPKLAWSKSWHVPRASSLVSKIPRSRYRPGVSKPKSLCSFFSIRCTLHRFPGKLMHALDSSVGEQLTPTRACIWRRGKLPSAEVLLGRLGTHTRCGASVRCPAAIRRGILLACWSLKQSRRLGETKRRQVPGANPSGGPANYCQTPASRPLQQLTLKLGRNDWTTNTEMGKPESGITMSRNTGSRPVIGTASGDFRPSQSTVAMALLAEMHSPRRA